MSSVQASVTARVPRKLPRMADESDVTVAYPSFVMERATMADGALHFAESDGLRRALRAGFFLLEIPPSLDLTPTDALARHFHEAPQGDALDVYRGFRNVSIQGDYQGYFDRPHDQWENLYLERANWSAHTPEGVAHVGVRLAELGIAVLRNVLTSLGIPARDFARVTAGLTEGGGHQMLGFNHFRADKPTRGCKFHRDSGWVTVLRSTEPGLLALIENELHTIDPVPGYFIINFGSSIEVLTEQLAMPVCASIHGVRRTHRVLGVPARTSYVMFLDSALDGWIHRYEHGAPVPVQRVLDFATQEVARTYDDDDAWL